MITRDPPHYLKPLLTTRTPKRLAWLFCKGTTVKRHGNFEQHFHVAALGTTHYTARKGQRKDTVQTYDHAANLWLDVSQYCVVGKRVVLFTYDLAEQLRLSQMLTYLPSLGWSIDKIVLEKQAAWCLLRNGKRSLMCCDLRSWTPVTFGKIAADVQGNYMPEYDITAGPSLAANRCKATVNAIREAVMQILNWIEGENLGSFRPTGSGQSYAGYRRRFSETRLLVHDDTSRLVAERTGMHTGRAEAWRHGTLKHGPYVEYDLHAAYATIGRDCAVPTIARGSISNVTDKRLERLATKYAVLVDATVTTDIECVPCFVGGRTLWPVGTFRTWLWDPELALAWDYAEKVKVHHAYIYERDYALKDFCTYVLEHMEGQTQVYGPITQRVLKHWSRSLIGRFGLRYRLWHKFGVQDPPDVRLVDYVDIEDGIKSELLLAGSQRLLLGDMQEAPESLPQIPGWVMSECRRRLWTLMFEATPELVYVDTDSLIMRAGTEPLAMATSMAAQQGWTLVQKATYNRLTIHGPRSLYVGDERRFSGLPLDATQTAPLEFDGSVMRSVKQSMKGGELNLIVSMPRTFHIKPTDLRRDHLPGGETQPYRIEMQHDQ